MYIGHNILHFEFSAWKSA